MEVFPTGTSAPEAIDTPIEPPGTTGVSGSNGTGEETSVAVFLTCTGGTAHGQLLYEIAIVDPVCPACAGCRTHPLLLCCLGPPDPPQRSLRHPPGTTRASPPQLRTFTGGCYTALSAGGAAAARADPATRLWHKQQIFRTGDAIICDRARSACMRRCHHITNDHRSVPHRAALRCTSAPSGYGVRQTTRLPAA